jgi:hypothetical protein
VTKNKRKRNKSANNNSIRSIKTNFFMHRDSLIISNAFNFLMYRIEGIYSVVGMFDLTKKTIASKKIVVEKRI